MIYGVLGCWGFVVKVGFVCCGIQSRRKKIYRSNVLLALRLLIVYLIEFSEGVLLAKHIL